MTDFKTATIEELQTIIKLHEDKIKTLKAEDTSNSNQADAVYRAVDFHERRIKNINEFIPTHPAS